MRTAMLNVLYFIRDRNKGICCKGVATGTPSRVYEPSRFVEGRDKGVKVSTVDWCFDALRLSQNAELWSKYIKISTVSCRSIKWDKATTIVDLTI